MAADTRASAPAAPRLRSLDALRGFDMLWIIGLAELFKALAAVTDSSLLDAFALQNDHVAWEGLRMHDLIFPLFMFISGMAVPYALGGKRERGAPLGSLLAGVWRRALILVVLGIIYNKGLQVKIEPQRYASVLGQIGIAYGIAASLYLFTKTWKGRAAWAVGILIGIAALQLFFPVPGVGAGVLTPEGVVNGWIDRGWLPGRLHGNGWFDPEGWLCTISASALTLGGVMTGDYVRRSGRPSYTAASRMMITGTALLFAGWICWHFGYPPIKSAWNSTFNLLAAGISLWLFVGFYLLIEFNPGQQLSFPLEVVGMNPLTIYLLEAIVSFPEVSKFFFGAIAHHCGEWEEVVLILGVLLIEWLLLYFLWKKRAFLRV